MIFFIRKGFLSKAVTSFVSSLALNPNYNLSHLCLENIKNAIFKALKSGYYHVLDIGSGSGLLRSVLFYTKLN